MNVDGELRLPNVIVRCSFIELNDGSCQGNVQVVAPSELPNYQSEIKHLATGASVGETLLLLKDHIESIYNELNDKPHLDDDQRKVQELLDTYIAKSHKYVTKESKKSDWFRR